MPSARKIANDCRAELLATDPTCAKCGYEPSNYSSLHYHHIIPQHTGQTDHEYGMLLCQRCHSIEHTIDRNRHKQVNKDGYVTSDHNPYRSDKRKVASIQAKARAILNAFA